MGQTASAERPLQSRQTPITNHTSPDYHSLGDAPRSETQEQESLLAVPEERRRSGFRSSVGGLSRIASARSRQQEPFSTYRRETRARSTLIGPTASPEEADTHGRDDVVLEQEERPLIMRDMERLNDAPITDIQATPMPRRGSVLSRLTSRVTQRSQRPANGNAPARESEERLTGGSALAEPSVNQRSSQTGRTRRNRLSMFELPTRPASSTQDPTPRRNSLSAATFPTASDLPDALDGPEIENMPRANRPHQQTPPTWVRPGRGGRLRRTLLGPLEELVARAQSRPQRNRNAAYNNPQVSADDTRSLISPQGTGNTVVNPQASSAHLEGAAANPAELDSPDRPRSWLPPIRDHALDTNSIRDDSSIQQVLGGRSSRLIRREDDTPLSRVLQLAAAAIARQLSGGNDQDPGLQSVGDDHFDGNLNDFIRTLNNAAEQSANDETSPTTNVPPLNFWRVFRFVNHNHSSGLNQHPPTLDPDPASNGRLVTLVVVGVRSVPSSSVVSETAGTLNTNLDDLMALPPRPVDGFNFGQDPQSQFGNMRNRLQRRRQSLTGNNPFPSQYESQRHQGTSSSRLSRTSGLNPLRRTFPSTTIASNQIRPPSPFPTADSQATNHAPTQNPAQRIHDEPPTLSSTVRQRRRNGIHGELGSGASRRHGVVEPTDVSHPEQAPANGRHWLIYVVGTNLSEDHPAFQAPSLFTDNPSYEDMVMLSTLLGPVKPPVATAEDVAAARGIYLLEMRRQDGRWTARAMDRQSNAGHGVPSPVELLSAEIVKCLVCQEEFEAGEEVRQLVTCRHVFHKICVDQWLTTGRNSCPTCRTTGVTETPASA